MGTSQGLPLDGLRLGMIAALDVSRLQWVAMRMPSPAFSWQPCARLQLAARLGMIACNAISAPVARELETQPFRN